MEPGLALKYILWYETEAEGHFPIPYKIYPADTIPQDLVIMHILSLCYETPFSESS